MLSFINWLRKFRQGRRSPVRDCEMSNQKQEMKDEPKTEVKTENDLDDVVNQAQGLRIGDQIRNFRNTTPANPEAIW